MDNEIDFYNWGNKISTNEIIYTKTREFLRATDNYPFTTFIEIQRINSEEVIIIDFNVELPQNPPVDIKPVERISINISSIEYIAPNVFALRKNFPNTPHQNLGPKGLPKGLCLFDEPYFEIMHNMTGEMFLDRIANWFKRAAIEELHLSDQPLEPLLISINRIIFDPELFDINNDNNLFVVRRYSVTPLILKAIPIDRLSHPEKNEVIFSFLSISVPPWHSRIIESTPVNFLELIELIRKLNYDLINRIRDYIHQLNKNKYWLKLLNTEIIILLRLPKTRYITNNFETFEYWAFLIHSTIEEISIKLGMKDKFNGCLVDLIGEHVAKDLDTINILPLIPTFNLSKNYAKQLSGLERDIDDIVVIGVGALGSQVVLNLARQGFGNWHIFDYDILLPHNLSRHGLTSNYEGVNKAQAIEYEINNLLNDGNLAKSYPINFLDFSNLESRNETISNIISECKLILDFSTSRSVSNYISNLESKSNRICMFINPKGTYLALLSEGKLRKVTINDLEKQLFVNLVNNPTLVDFYSNEISYTRYAGSCRDETVTLSMDTIGIFSGIASKFIKNHYYDNDPSIMVWGIRDNDLSIETYNLQVNFVREFEINDWKIRLPINIIDTLKKIRSGHFPNETGGILIGNFDVINKTIYVEIIISSPIDSIEWPFSYIRGIDGLIEKVKYIKKITGNELFYVGEWHSHPQEISSFPSGDDIKAHNFIVEEMGIEGYPGLMIIIGNEQDPYILLK